MSFTKQYSFFHLLLYATAAFMCGIFLYELISTSNALPIAAIIFATVFALASITAYFYYTKNILIPLLTLFACALGAGRYHYQIAQHQQTQTILQGNTLDIIGTITAIEPAQHKYFKHTVTIQTKQITLHKNMQEIHTITTNIMLYTQFIKNLCISDVVAIPNLRCSKSNNQSFTSFLRKKNVACTLFATKTDLKLLNRPKLSAFRALHNVKQNVLHNCKQGMSPQLYQLFTLMFLGIRTSSKQQLQPIKQLFLQWGLSHYLARSALHLIIFILVWLFLLQLLPIPFWAKQALLLCLCIVYSLLSWPSVAFNRAFITFLLYKGCTLLGLPYRMLHLLLLVCLITLVYNPTQCLFLDFQLSFALAGALAWFYSLQLHTTKKKPLKRSIIDY